MTYRIVFMGTPNFALPSLDAITASGATCLGVFTQPPRPKGRGHQIQESPIALRAHQLGLPVWTPLSFKADPSAITTLQDLKPDLILVAAYGLLLPKIVLDIPRLGCVNVHASLLPRWRGASPIQSALRAGDGETGITLMRMDVGLDTGDMLSQQKIGITAAMNAATLQDELALLGGRMVQEFLQNPEESLSRAIPQPAMGVTHAPKITREDGLLDFKRPIQELLHCVQAYTPAPGAWCFLQDKRLKILKAQGVVAEHSPGVAGTICNEAFHIACGDGFLAPEILQLEGKGPMTPADFMRGHPGLVGAQLQGKG